MATITEYTTSLVQNLKNLFTRKETVDTAVENASTTANTVYYTTDTREIIMAGQAYGDIGARIPYGAVDSTSTKTAFTATIPGIHSLEDGTMMWLKNGVVTSASGFTININGLGAKPVYDNMAATTRLTTHFNINYTMLFVYDSTRVSGGCWIYYKGYDTTTMNAHTFRRAYSTYTPYTALYRYMILLSYSETQLLPINSTSNSTSTSKTLTTEPFNPFGPIFYYAATSTVSSGSAISASYMWEQYLADLRYSFNTGTTLTANKDVFIVATPQDDGTAVLASSPISQTLPTSADGYIYIYLGHAYDTYRIQLTINHPVYYHDGTAIRLWDGSPLDTHNVIASTVMMSNLPTSDPAVAGQLWNDSGTLKISTGS